MILISPSQAYQVGPNGERVVIRDAQMKYFSALADAQAILSLVAAAVHNPDGQNGQVQMEGNTQGSHFEQQYSSGAFVYLTESDVRIYRVFGSVDWAPPAKPMQQGREPSKTYSFVASAGELLASRPSPGTVLSIQVRPDEFSAINADLVWTESPSRIFV